MKRVLVAGILAAIMASLCGCAGNAHTVSTGSTSAASQNSEAVSENSSEAVSQSAATDVGEITEENFMDFPTTDESEFETYSVDGGVCIKYCSSDDPVVVVPETINGETVVALADTVFFQKNGLVAVSLPDTVKSVGGIIMDCTNLKYVDLGKGLEEITNTAVCASDVIEKIYIPKGVEFVDNVAYQCPNLKDIYVPDTVTEINYLVSSDSEGAVIHTPSGSVAEQWAMDNGYTVVNDYE